MVCVDPKNRSVGKPETSDIFWAYHWLIMGKCGSCNNIKTTCSFLMLYGYILYMEIMHILLICLLNVNFCCYGNLKLPLAYNGKMRILQ